MVPPEAGRGRRRTPGRRRRSAPTNPSVIVRVEQLPDLILLSAMASLVTEGLYRWVRHPMYLGILIFQIGATLAMESALLLVATIVYAIPFTIARIVAEEHVLIQGLGDQYRSFVSRVPALVPFAR